ncbi:MAG: hypothetical protein RSC29_04945, partial [Oscillospiraceae bacterium]
MTKRNAIKMIFKALSSDVMELTGVGKYVSYKIMKGKTFLYQRYNISEEYGRVTGIYGINISNGGDVGEGQIKIGDRVLKGVTREDEKLIGYNVHYYWKETNSGDASLFMMLEDKNSILKINAEDINDFSQGELSYTDGKNIRKIKILPSFDLIFNGCKDVPSDLTMLPNTGNITLIKNNKTSEYDVVIVKSYEHMIVQSVDLEKQIIYTDVGELEASNTNVREFSIKDTAKKDVEIKSLLKFDALLVAQSRNDEVCEILFSDKIVNGTIQEINSYGKKKKVKINGKEYIVAVNLLEHDFKINEKATFHLDYNGEIAAVESLKINTEQYAYIVGVSKPNGLSENVSIKLFTGDGNIKILDMTDKVYIDDDYGKAYEIITKKLFKNGVFVPQLVEYETRSDGKVNRLTHDTKLQYSGYDDKKNELETIRYKRRSQTFLGKIDIENSTAIFIIPRSLEDKEFSIGTANYFENDEDYCIEAYKKDDGDIVSDVIIIYVNDAVKSEYTDDFVAVQDVVSGINDDGDIVERLKCLRNGKEVTYDSKEIGVLKDVSSGDLIQINVSTNGILLDFKKVYDMKSDELLTENPTGVYNSKFRLIKGNVWNVNDGRISITTEEFTNSVPNILENHTASLYKIYKYDSEKDTVKSGNIRD